MRAPASLGIRGMAIRNFILLEDNPVQEAKRRSKQVARLRRRFAGFGSIVHDYLAGLSCDEEIHCAPVDWVAPPPDKLGRRAASGLPSRWSRRLRAGHRMAQPGRQLMLAQHTDFSSLHT